MQGREVGWREGRWDCEKGREWERVVVVVVVMLTVMVEVIIMTAMVMAENNDLFYFNLCITSPALQHPFDLPLWSCLPSYKHRRAVFCVFFLAASSAVNKGIKTPLHLYFMFLFYLFFFYLFYQLFALKDDSLIAQERYDVTQIRGFTFFLFFLFSSLPSLLSPLS